MIEEDIGDPQLLEIATRLPRELTQIDLEQLASKLSSEGGLLPENHDLTLAISLDASDELIHEKITEILRDKRKESDRGGREITEKDFANWYIYGILPVFDLSIWSIIHDTKITHSQLGDAIWPDASFNRPERIRKVSMKYLNSVFNLRTINRLDAIIQAEPN